MLVWWLIMHKEGSISINAYGIASMASIDCLSVHVLLEWNGLTVCMLICLHVLDFLTNLFCFSLHVSTFPPLAALFTVTVFFSNFWSIFCSLALTTASFPGCNGACFNGGRCVGGECECPQDYIGTRCEFRKSPNGSRSFFFSPFCFYFLTMG